MHAVIAAAAVTSSSTTACCRSGARQQETPRSEHLGSLPVPRENAVDPAGARFRPAPCAEKRPLPPVGAMVLLTCFDIQDVLVSLYVAFRIRAAPGGLRHALPSAAAVGRVGAGGRRSFGENRSRHPPWRTTGKRHEMDRSAALTRALCRTRRVRPPRRIRSPEEPPPTPPIAHHLLNTPAPHLQAGPSPGLRRHRRRDATRGIANWAGAGAAVRGAAGPE